MTIFIVCNKPNFVSALVNQINDKNIAVFESIPESISENFISVNGNFICLEEDFEDISKLKDLYKKGANVIKPFNVPLVMGAISHFLGKV